MRLNNKEIYLLRLAITTKCILGCRYCFVKKNNKVMPYNIAIKALGLFLISPGKEKILMIYGGEPLLCFNLVKKVIMFAQGRAKSLNRQLTISLGTNAILIKQKHLDFLKKRKIKLAISLDGQKEFHDYARIFPDQRGSSRHIINRIPLIRDYIAKKDLCILCAVLPSFIHYLYDNLIYLTNLGFESINIEPIQNSKFAWSYEQKEIFLTHLNRFGNYIMTNISKNNFIFLNSVNRELKDRRISSPKKNCSFFENLEVYPNGEMTFSPFLINSINRKNYIIGNISKGISGRFKSCKYEANTQRCKNCRKDYFGNSEELPFGRNNKANEVVRLRNLYSLHFAQRILQLAKKDKIFKKYLEEARERVFE